MSDITEKDQIFYLYSQERWSMSKLGRESDFSYSQVRRMIIESDQVEKRSHKEACNTENFKDKLKEVNEGKELSEEHRKAISDGINSSENFAEAMENQSERLRKDIPNEKLKKLYLQNDENARKVSELVDLSHRQVLSRLKECEVDTSQDEPWNKGLERSDETKRKMSEAKKGKTWEEIYGKEHAEWRKENIGEKISEAKEGYSRKPETKAKLRKARVEEIERKRNDGDQIFPSYNKSAIRLIEEFGNKNGFVFQHAENGGEYFIREVGCWVDGYDIENDVIVEVYEPHHYNSNGELREKDKKRENDIKTLFDPNSFYRIKVDNKNNILKTEEI